VTFDPGSVNLIVVWDPRDPTFGIKIIRCMPVWDNNKQWSLVNIAQSNMVIVTSWGNVYLQTKN